MTSSPQRAMNRAGTGTRQNWLVVFNCQATGLGNCLSLLCDDIVVVNFDPATFAENREAILPHVEGFDRILLAPGLDKMFDLDWAGRDNVWQLPPVYFSGYHPDICLLAQDGDLSTGPQGHYHSTLAYAAFRCGLQETEALALFNGETYRQLGYFDRWVLDRDLLIRSYASCGFDIGGAFVRWSRQGPFMHNTNHPKITCLNELAKVLLARAGLPIADSEHLPHDNLTNGPVYPVYPEIGDRLGVKGSYLFKEAAHYKLMGLERFISQSFDVYRNSPDASATIPDFFPAIENAISYVRATR